MLFLGALFVMVQGAVEVGLIERLGGYFVAAIRAAPESARRIVAVEIMLWLSAIISGESLSVCLGVACPSFALGATGERAGAARALAFRGEGEGGRGIAVGE